MARERKHIKGEHSEVGTSGYYIDGLCDAAGCTAMMIGIFIYLKNNPPRRGYVQLPMTADSKDSNIVYSLKVTTNKVVQKCCFFSLQLILNSAAWNRYIAIYQDLLERTDVTPEQKIRQHNILINSFFFVVTILWRIINVHNLTHLLLLAIFCDKLWEFLKNMQYLGYGILLSIICLTEVNIIDVKKSIYHKIST